MPIQKELAEILYDRVPAGVGSTGPIRLGADEVEGAIGQRRPLPDSPRLQK